MILKVANLIFKSFLLVVFATVLSCGDEDYVPKPKACLRLDYPEPKYIKTNLDVPFSFERNELAAKVVLKELQATTKSYGINLGYPSLKGTIFLTYKAVENNKKNLNDFLKDAEKFTIEHTKKADEIPRYPFENSKKRVFGMLSEVKGDVASPAQFYITDSVNHFLTGSLYFYAKPNYDSILPAAHYLENDIKHLMETITWK